MSEGVEIDTCEVLLETPKAIMVRLDSDKSERWIPQSQIHDDSEVWKKGQKGMLVVSAWFAQKEFA